MSVLAAAASQLPQLHAYVAAGFSLTVVAALFIALIAWMAFDDSSSRPRTYVIGAVVTFIVVTAFIALASLSIYAAEWTDYRRSSR